MLFSQFRKLVQLSSAVLTNSYFASAYTRFINTNALKGICVPFINCYSCPSALFSCPVGTLQHFAALRAIPFYLLGFLSLIGVTVGRMACGWICPFGFLQELLYKIGSQKYKIPHHLSYIKYVILLFLVVFVPYMTAVPWFSKLCPVGSLAAAIPWALWDPVSQVTGQPVLTDRPAGTFYIAILLLIGFLIWFVASKRPFCRVACPLGALFSLFNRYSLLHLEVMPQCDGCDVCKVNCPVDLNIAKEVNSRECIRCLECTRCAYVRVISPLSSARELRWTKSEKV